MENVGHRNVRDDESSAGLIAFAVDEFAAAVKRGERPQLAEFVSRHPTIADVLYEILPALETLETLEREMQCGHGNTSPATVGVRETLGDFLIEQEIGRGGMGVVYRAHQRSLGRDVALKGLPMAAVLDPRRLQRFRNEARAAAMLHHRHIVPVYAVGVERGIHYYAMQLIDGCSLASLIAQNQQSRSGVGSATERLASNEAGTAPLCPLATRQSHTPVSLNKVYQHDQREYFRAVTRLICQAASAIEYAHDHGIIHRDLKPANLLLDTEQHLWVTDFGLAQLESDATLTQTGDMLGTLRYMS
ncbi:MAG: serine/threonine protein kinase, partial [Planctomycetales bacterium]|nr:serine/threonine protein kinase [Planctomycetales bacterium]